MYQHSHPFEHGEESAVSVNQIHVIDTREGFEDVRDVQARLEAAGITIERSADADSDGPAHFIVTDPDDNVIMFDQHVPKPE